MTLMKLAINLRYYVQLVKVVGLCCNNWREIKSG